MSGSLRLRYGFRTLYLSPGTITVGRRATSDIFIDDARASRDHARLIIGASSAAIQDCGSANGVLVNGQRIEGLQRLQANDLIQIAGQTLEVLGFGAPPVASSEEPETTVVGYVDAPASFKDTEPSTRTGVTLPPKPQK